MSASGFTAEHLEARTLLASVSGFVFEDANANRVRDEASDFGLPGTRVLVFDVGPNGRVGGRDDRLVSSATANNNGFYFIDGLPAGRYVVRFDRIGGDQNRTDLVVGFRNVGPDTHDSDADPRTRLTAVFTLKADGTAEQSLGAVTQLRAIVNGTNESFNLPTTRAGQSIRAVIRFTNQGPLPFVFNQVQGGIDVQDGVVTGRGWDFPADLEGRTIRGGRSLDVTVVYRADVAGNFGGSGSFVPVGGNEGDRRSLPGTIIGAVDGMNAAITERLKAPRRNQAEYGFRVRYTSTAAVREETIDSRDVEIRGPRGFRVLGRLRQASDVENLGSDWWEATYRVAAPGGRWDKNDAGRYQVRMLRRSVFDDGNRSAPARLLGTFAFGKGKKVLEKKGAAASEIGAFGVRPTSNEVAAPGTMIRSAAATVFSSEVIEEDGGAVWEKERSAAGRGVIRRGDTRVARDGRGMRARQVSPLQMEPVEAGTADTAVARGG